MKKNVSSRKKPGKKASSPSRSTTSSIIEVEEPKLEITQLSTDEKRVILETMYRGGSPAWVCKDRGLNYSCYLKSIQEDNLFRQSIEDAKAALSENIAFYLFRTAMEGNVSAQTNFLKLFPPVKWNSVSQNSESLPKDNEWVDKMSDKELLQLAKEMDIHVPDELFESPPNS